MANVIHPPSGSGEVLLRQKLIVLSLARLVNSRHQRPLASSLAGVGAYPV